MREPFWDLGERIKALRKRQNLTQQEFATRLGVTQPTVHRWEKGAFEPDARMLRTLADLAGVSVSEFRYGAEGGAQRMVPVVGYVGAGAQVFPIDDQTGAAGTDEVEAPTADPLGVVAVRVRGDSMYPVYGEGDILFYSRDYGHGVDVTSCLGRDCVVKVINGPTLVKRVELGGGRGLFTLMSYNAHPVVNARLEWASPVRWVKRR